MLRDVLRKSLTLFPEAMSQREALQRALEVAHVRLIVTGICFSMVFLVVGIRLMNLAVSKDVPDRITEMTASAAILHGRGNITDRNGFLLATTLATNSLYADPRIVLDAKEAAAQLATVLKGQTKEAIYEKLTAPRAFIWLARHLTPTQKADILRLGIPGIDFREDVKRVYPYGSLVSHVVGFADIDNVGLAGIEKAYDEVLRQDGESVTLSLDINLQFMLRDELVKAVEEFKADGGAGLVMDVKTGEILSMVSLPDFDPNLPDVKSEKAMFNQVTLGVYEMGSTMKIINTAMALDSGLVTVNSMFDARYPLKVGRFTVTDYRGENRILTVEEILKLSSNIGSAKMALFVGMERQKNFMQRVGFFDKLDLELPEIGIPQSPKKWGEAHSITMSYGYGISLTPVHFARAIAGIVNQGLMVKPTLLKVESPQVEATRVVSPEVSRQVHRLMRLAVSEGRVSKAEVPGFHVAGKTGTVNLRKAKGRGYQTKYVRTSFVGVFPREPKYVVWVMLDNPKGLPKTFGFNAAGWNAAPLGARVIERTASLLGMVPEVEIQDEPVAAPLPRFR